MYGRFLYIFLFGWMLCFSSEAQTTKGDQPPWLDQNLSIRKKNYKTVGTRIKRTSKKSSRNFAPPAYINRPRSVPPKKVITSPRRSPKYYRQNPTGELPGYKSIHSNRHILRATKNRLKRYDRGPDVVSNQDIRKHLDKMRQENKKRQLALRRWYAQSQIIPQKKKKVKAQITDIAGRPLRRKNYVSEPLVFSKKQPVSPTIPASSAKLYRSSRSISSSLLQKSTLYSIRLRRSNIKKRSSSTLHLFPSRRTAKKTITPFPISEKIKKVVERRASAHFEPAVVPISTKSNQRNRYTSTFPVYRTIKTSPKKSQQITTPSVPQRKAHAKARKSLAVYKRSKSHPVFFSAIPVKVSPDKYIKKDYSSYKPIVRKKNRVPVRTSGLPRSTISHVQKPNPPRMRGSFPSVPQRKTHTKARKSLAVYKKSKSHPVFFSAIPVKVSPGKSTKKDYSSYKPIVRKENRQPVRTSGFPSSTVSHVQKPHSLQQIGGSLPRSAFSVKVSRILPSMKSSPKEYPKPKQVHVRPTFQPSYRKNFDHAHALKVGSGLYIRSSHRQMMPFRLTLPKRLDGINDVFQSRRVDEKHKATGIHKALPNRVVRDDSDDKPGNRKSFISSLWDRMISPFYFLSAQKTKPLRYDKNEKELWKDLYD